MIAFVAPFPRPELVREGWMSRIAAVDRLFADRPRVYLDVVDDRSAGPPVVERVSPTAEVWRLNLALASHYDRLRRVVLAAEMVYVHTFHLARWVLPFYRTGKVVTDVHGATAEEELMYGKPACQRFYDAVETAVLDASRWAVVVTEAMADHLRAKHPGTRCEFLVMPIVEAAHGAPPPRPAPGARPRVVYSGGPQRWQNVDLMMDVARERIDACDFTFLTNDAEPFTRAARARGIADRVEIRFAPKAELPGVYARADYGLVLRDDVVVNRVACPTKLSEYLWFGVLPVVKSPDLGDFARLGYRPVALDDFRAGRLPDAATGDDMRRRNADAVAQLDATFARSARALQALPARLPRERPDAVAFLTEHERNVLYPAVSSVQLETAAGPRVVAQHFAAPYDAVAFELDDVPGLHRITWMPIDRECVLRLADVRIADADGRPVRHRMSGNHVADGGGALTFRTRPPLLHFDVEPRRAPRTFYARFELALVGDEVLRALPEAPPPPAPAHGPVYELLTSSPTIVRLYWRFVKPFRDRMRGLGDVRAQQG